LQAAGKPPAQDDGCDIEYIDEGRCRAAMEHMPADEVVHALAETFRVLSDPTRIRIIAALSRDGLCVCDLAKILGLTGSAVSHQLRLLRGRRLVKYRKEGKAAFYSLDDEHISSLFAQGIRHVQE